MNPIFAGSYQKVQLSEKQVEHLGEPHSNCRQPHNCYNCDKTMNDGEVKKALKMGHSRKKIAPGRKNDFFRNFLIFCTSTYRDETFLFLSKFYIFSRSEKSWGDKEKALHQRTTTNERRRTNDERTANERRTNERTTNDELH